MNRFSIMKIFFILYEGDLAIHFRKTRNKAERIGNIRQLILIIKCPYFFYSINKNSNCTN